MYKKYFKNPFMRVSVFDCMLIPLSIKKNFPDIILTHSGLTPNLPITIVSPSLLNLSV